MFLFLLYLLKSGAKVVKKVESEKLIAKILPSMKSKKRKIIKMTKKVSVFWCFLLPIS